MKADYFVKNIVISRIFCYNATKHRKQRSFPYEDHLNRHIGIRPEDMKILVVKSAAHFRASFGKAAKKIIEVDAPGIAPPDPKTAGLAHVRRPIYPLDET